jgi:CheY-like chemotaxis protein
MNRRRHDRADVNGGAIVQTHERTIRCRIVNLSVGGVLVQAPIGVYLVPDTHVTVELELDRIGWARHAGPVARVVGDRLFAIAFDELGPRLGAVIEGVVRAACEARRAPRVVVVDPSPPRRQRLATALRDAGTQPVEAATPLEALDLLEGSRVGFSAVAVASRTRSQTESDELVEYLAEAHPEVQVALIVDRPDERPANPRSGVSMLPCGESSDLQEPVRELLARLT